MAMGRAGEGNGSSLRHKLFYTVLYGLPWGLVWFANCSGWFGYLYCCFQCLANESCAWTRLQIQNISPSGFLKPIGIARQCGDAQTERNCRQVRSLVIHPGCRDSTLDRGFPASFLATFGIDPSRGEIGIAKVSPDCSAIEDEIGLKR
jgi:hypothetical protein